MNDFHLRLGQSIHVFRAGLALIVLVSVAFMIMWFVNHHSQPVASISAPAPLTAQERHNDSPKDDSESAVKPTPKAKRLKIPSTPKSAPAPLTGGAQTPPQTQTCAPGANCAISNGQQGGITAGQLIVGQKTWDAVISQERQEQMIAILKSATPGKIRMNWLLDEHDSYKASGGILVYVRESWMDKRSR